MCSAAAARATLSAKVACMDQAVNHCHSDGSSCSPVFTTATTTLPPQQPPVCPVEVKHLDSLINVKAVL